MPLERLVHLGTSFETSDQRDSIYTLLSLANDVSLSAPADLPSIVPDYSKNTLAVFADFMLYCCQRSDCLDIICRPWAPVSPFDARTLARGNSTGHALRTSIPSWIASRDGLPYGECLRCAYNLSRLAPSQITGVKLKWTPRPSIRISGLMKLLKPSASLIC